MNLQEELHKVAQANKDHQYALKVYTERLETELESVQRLLSIAEQSDGEPDVNVGGTVIVPDATKAAGPVAIDILSEQSSVLKDDIEKRYRYLRSTDVHPMRATELEALSEAVYAENYRLHALEQQQRGQHPFAPPPSHYENTTGIDWQRVATKVSNASSSTNIQRTARECEIRWIGSRHPRINQSAWTPDEISRVKDLVNGRKEGEIDWVEIATKLGTNRTPIECFRYAIPRRAHTWTPESDRRLVEAVRIYGTGNWQQVARLVSEDATATQCQSRYTRSLDPTISRLPWDEEEDARLREAVEVYGTAWSEIAEFIPNRNSEQCRERWQERLAPTLARGKWSEEEDQALLATVKQVGEGKWKEISRVLGNGRTDNMCRSRFHVLSKRKLREDAAPSSPAFTTSQAPQELQIRFHPNSQLSVPLPSNTNVPRRRSALRNEGTAYQQDMDPSNGAGPSKQQVSKSRPNPRRKQTTYGMVEDQQTEVATPQHPPCMAAKRKRGNRSKNQARESTGEPSPKKSRVDKDSSQGMSSPGERISATPASPHGTAADEVEDGIVRETSPPDQGQKKSSSKDGVRPSESASTANDSMAPGSFENEPSNTEVSSRGRSRGRGGGRGRGRGEGRGVESNTPSTSTAARKSARLAGKSIDPA